MNHPLRAADDRAALIEGIQDGTIEVSNRPCTTYS